MEILHQMDIRQWDAPVSVSRQESAVTALESGQILYFENLSFEILTPELTFLTAGFSELKTKNVSFNTNTGLLKDATLFKDQQVLLINLLQRFCDSSNQLISQLFPIYKSALEIGRTSFRPIEIAGRKTSPRQDDTRLHVDAFPATPNAGNRILRVFTNVNPDNKHRHWRVGETFTKIANEFAPRARRHSRLLAKLLKTFKFTKTYRTEYDHLMLQIHDRMKKDLQYQARSESSEIFFPPGSTWIVQTDHVPHAALAGQHVLEQTFYLPINAMENPSLSPLRILEKIVGKALV